MRKEKLVLANTFALAVAIIWVICSLLIALFPALTLAMTTWIMHGMALSAWNLTWGNFILGGVTLVVAAWLSAYLFGWCWEIVSGKQSVLHEKRRVREA
jgi:hypothetical protein